MLAQPVLLESYEQDMQFLMNEAGLILHWDDPQASFVIGNYRYAYCKYSIVHEIHPARF